MNFGKRSAQQDRQPDRLEMQEMQGEHTSIFNPHFVVLAEGAGGRAQTAKLLGIKRLTLSDPSLIGIHFFDRKNSQLELEDRITHFTLGLVDKGLFIFKRLQTDQHELQILKSRLLFKVPGQDYLIQGLDAEQERYITKTIKKIAGLTQLIRLLKQKHSLDDPLIKSLKQKKKSLKANFEEYKKTQAIIGRRFFDFNPRTSFRYVSTHYFPVTMRRTEQLLTFIGRTPLLPCGDVAQEVDSASGVGAKTALETSPIFDQLLRDFQQQGQSTTTALLKYALATSYSMEFAVEQGFEKRGFYKPNTEQLQREVDFSHLFNREEEHFLESLLLKQEQTQLKLDKQEFKHLLLFIMKLEKNQKLLPPSFFNSLQIRLIKLLVLHAHDLPFYLPTLFPLRERMFQLPLIRESLANYQKKMDPLSPAFQSVERVIHHLRTLP